MDRKMTPALDSAITDALFATIVLAPESSQPVSYADAQT